VSLFILEISFKVPHMGFSNILTLYIYSPLLFHHLSMKEGSLFLCTLELY